MVLSGLYKVAYPLPGEGAGELIKSAVGEEYQVGKRGREYQGCEESILREIKGERSKNQNRK